MMLQQPLVHGASKLRPLQMVHSSDGWRTRMVNHQTWRTDTSENKETTHKDPRAPQFHVTMCLASEYVQSTPWLPLRKSNHIGVNI